MEPLSLTDRGLGELAGISGLVNLEELGWGWGLKLSVVSVVKCAPYGIIV